MLSEEELRRRNAESDAQREAADREIYAGIDQTERVLAAAEDGRPTAETISQVVAGRNFTSQWPDCHSFFGAEMVPLTARADRLLSRWIATAYPDQPIEPHLNDLRGGNTVAVNRLARRLGHAKKKSRRGSLEVEQDKNHIRWHGKRLYLPQGTRLFHLFCLLAEHENQTVSLEMCQRAYDGGQTRDFETDAEEHKADLRIRQAVSRLNNRLRESGFGETALIVRGHIRRRHYITRGVVEIEKAEGYRLARPV